MMTPLPAPEVLERYFHEARGKILDLAGIFDRLGRGTQSADVDSDARLERIRQALEILQDKSGGRAERIQKIFSLDYDPHWEKPTPR